MAARARRRRRLDDDVGGPVFGPWLKLAYVVFLLQLFAKNVQSAKTPGNYHYSFLLFYKFTLNPKITAFNVSRRKMPNNDFN